jgi:hypothetical protein
MPRIVWSIATGVLDPAAEAKYQQINRRLTTDWNRRGLNAHSARLIRDDRQTTHNEGDYLRL